MQKPFPIQYSLRIYDTRVPIGRWELGSTVKQINPDRTREFYKAVHIFYRSAKERFNSIQSAWEIFILFQKINIFCMCVYKSFVDVVLYSKYVQKFQDINAISRHKWGILTLGSLQRSNLDDAGLSDRRSPFRLLVCISRVAPFYLRSSRCDV